MKKHVAPFINSAKKGFIIGAAASMCIYVCLRIILHDFDFTIAEETILLCKVLATGGAIVGGAILSFLAVEIIVLNIASSKAFFIASSFAIIIASSFVALIKNTLPSQNKDSKMYSK